MAKSQNAPARNAAQSEFTASKFEGNLLGEGDHSVTIESAQHTEAAANENWNDRTPQLAVKFKNEDGVFTSWYNKRGYMTFDELTPVQQASGKFEPRGDQGYAVDVKTGNRVESPAKTAAAMSIIGQLGTNALNLPVGTGFGSKDLVGAEVGIHVARNERKQLRVTYSMSVDAIPA